jgi:hypothetical protein
MKLSDVSDDAMAVMERRQVPLGFGQEDWRQCITDFVDTLDQVGVQDADVRLQGSGAYFFSRSPDPRKRFPQTAAEVMTQAPDRASGEEAVKAWSHAGYDEEGAKPRKHFWDSRRQLRLSTARSDYDVQLSSDVLARMILATATREAIPPDQLTSPRGGQYQQELLSKAAPAIGLWAARWSEARKRKVNIAAFPAAGPPGSAAFDDKDWVCQAADREG